MIGSLSDRRRKSSEKATDPVLEVSGIRLRRNWRQAVLCVCAGAALVGALVCGYAAHAANQEVAQGEEALAVANEHVATLLSYTPSTVESDLDTELSWLGGDFRDEYESLVRDTIAPAAKAAKVTVVAKIVASGVAASDGERVTVLAFLNVDTSTPKVKTPQLTGSRVRIVLEQTNGRWTITQFKPLEGASFSVS